MLFRSPETPLDVASDKDVEFDDIQDKDIPVCLCPETPLGMDNGIGDKYFAVEDDDGIKCSDVDNVKCSNVITITTADYKPKDSKGSVTFKIEPPAKPVVPQDPSMLNQSSIHDYESLQQRCKQQ